MTKYIYHYYAETTVGREIYPMSGMINWAKPFDSDEDYQELKNKIATPIRKRIEHSVYTVCTNDVIIKSLTFLHIVQD